MGTATHNEGTAMQCSICLREIDGGTGPWGADHNASPVTEGRCCRICNETVVIPIRMEQARGNDAATSDAFIEPMLHIVRGIRKSDDDP